MSGLTGQTARQKGNRLLGALLVLVALFVSATGLLTRIDYLVFDVGQRIFPRPVPDDILIVAIDEESLSRLGRWPWVRDRHAQLLDRICRSAPRAIGLDIAFSEPSDQAESDAALAEAVQRCGRVVLPLVIETPVRGGALIESPPLPALLEGAAGLGRVSVRLDEDGIARSVDLREGVGSPAWPLFSDELLRVSRGQPPRLPAAIGAAPDFVLVREGRRLFEYSGPPGSMRSISYADVLSGTVPEEFFRNRMVLIGVTASGLGDFLPTPVSALSYPMPGVEVQANVLRALDEGRLIVPLSRVWVSILCGLLALIPLLWLPRLRPLPGLLASLVWILFILTLGATLPAVALVWFPPGGALLAALLAFPLWSGLRLEAARRHLDAELRLLGEQLPETTPESADLVQKMSFEQRIAWVQQAQEHLRLLERQRNEALAFISHDLRSPLASVVHELEGKSVCETVRLRPPLLRALGMVQEFLQLARAEALMPEQMKEVDLGAVLHQAADELHERFRKEGRELVRIGLDEPVWVHGNFESLERCGINLLHNALVHAPDKAPVRLGVDRQPREVRFWVENPGEMLGEAEIERLFLRFSRGERGASQPTSTGLGLYYVRTVAERHGGSAGVDFPDGRIRFWVALPKR